jgi:hypothetical protein
MRVNNFDEWIDGSAIDPELTELNRLWLDCDQQIFSRLIPDIDAATDRVHPDAQWRWIEARYFGMSRCGWWFSGINLTTLQPSDFGCFKADSPRLDYDKSLVYPSLTIHNLPLHSASYLLRYHAWTLLNAQLRYKKYEHPLRAGGVEAGVFALRVTPKIWQTIAHRYQLALPEDYDKLPHSAFWQWVLDNPTITIWLTEGVKKAAALLSCGYCAIALPGVSTGFRTPKDDFGHPDGPSYLHPELQVLATGGREFLFAFDQDSRPSTIHMVNKSLKKTAFLLKRTGCSVTVATWSSILAKGVDDLIVAVGREIVDRLYREASTFEEWQTQQYKRLTYSGQTINRKYFLNNDNPSDVMPPEGTQLFGIVGYKGGGKTHLISYLIDPILKSGRRRVLLLTHLIQLGLQTAKRLGKLISI